MKKTLNIVVPMAGAGSRFAAAGYSIPKPLIPIHGIPMIQVVIENVRPTRNHRFIFICQKSHVKEYELSPRLKSWAPGCEIVALDGLTEGAACTVLSAKVFFDNDQELMIVNSDQYIDADIDAYLAEMETRKLDGLIMTMKSSDPKWSYVGLSASGDVNRVVEKEVISDEATVGIYNYRRGRDFVVSAESMISENLRVNNEFYVAPTFNQLAKLGKKIGFHNIGKELSGMYGLGTPTDLRAFLENAISLEAIKPCL